MDLGISGRKAIICASSKGLGRACATALAEAGCALVVNGRDPATLAATATALREQFGVSVHEIAGDLNDPATRAALIAAAPDADILVNNNGGPPFKAFEAITRAIRLVEAGARFIATNPDPSGPSQQGTLPATGSVAALISTATGRTPYFIGKPNPLMMRSALNRIEAHSESTAMVGDRMDTDMISGLEAGLQTFLVLTGSTRAEQVEEFPYRPTRVVDSVEDLVALVRPATEG